MWGACYQQYTGGNTRYIFHVKASQLVKLLWSRPETEKQSNEGFLQIGYACVKNRKSTEFFI